MNMKVMIATIIAAIAACWPTTTLAQTNSGSIEFHPKGDGTARFVVHGKAGELYQIQESTSEGTLTLGLWRVLNQQPITATSDTFDVTLPITSGANQAFYRFLQLTPELIVSLAPNSPVSRFVTGGSTGVVSVVFKLTSLYESICLQKLGITLSSTATNVQQDIVRVTVGSWSSSSLLGEAYFMNGQTSAVIFLSPPITLPANSATEIIVRTDFAPISPCSSGRSGDIIAIVSDASQTQGVLLNSGKQITAVGCAKGQNMILAKSYPAIMWEPISPNHLISYTPNTLLKFSISADPSGDIGIGKLSFRLAGSDVGNVSVAIRSSTDGRLLAPAQVVSPSSETNGVAEFYPQVDGVRRILEIAAGTTRYFQVDGLLGNVSPSSVLVTTMLTEEAGWSGKTFDQLSPAPLGFFIWTPNSGILDTDYPDADWFNGFRIPGLWPDGISQTRTGQ
ncbi:MAG: hypothetical protein NT155_02670 [Candidatus Staskawiczbacteria bacterium]|nr:hypothetical protein [Candidatus Staskawiczbacteria bacterium]